ncbi:MAG: BBP7 family outer membrane beta-barrel protein, partial [Planctomycetales bacterium]|nr:BBP7 family outer membrane beta-barrel protein [Planctomycetales bacterium]
LTLRGGYWLTNSVQLSAGYTLMLLNDVRRAGGQIDSRIDARALDPNFAGPATRPQFSATSDLLWLQAFTCGLTYHY